MHRRNTSLRLSASAAELRDSFNLLLDPRGVAALLDVTYETLVYYLYELGDRRYRQFQIAKRRGGTRTIAEPKPGLKAIQSKLVQVLQAVYTPRASVQGFVAGRSIGTNALLHEGSTFVLNLDLEDYFPSINFGRVRGLFMAAPYALPPAVATVLAQICCFDNALPQGAPTSPTVANMISSRMDAALQKLARRHRCVYSRYADDITLSTRRAAFPKSLARIDTESGQLLIAPGLEAVITQNGFRINYDKVRLQGRDKRQEVTGLTVNHEANVRRSFVRQIRAMLHAWEKYGYDAAEAEYHKHYENKSRAPFKDQPKFADVVKGKLDFLCMIKGKDSPVYEKLLGHYVRLNLQYTPRPHALEGPNHLRRFRDGIWILECAETGDQGTAFFLRGVGAITCQHVLGPRTQAFRAERPDIKYRVTVVRQSVVTDIAILRVEGAAAFEFDPLTGRNAAIGELITVAGFPNWVRGTSLWQMSGRIAGTHNYFGQPCFRVSCPIVTGASGGPVFDAYRRVIGIAARGTANVETGAESVEHGVIPIARVFELLRSAQ